MGNLSGESREQNRKDKVTRFRSVMYARQLGILVNTLGSHLKEETKVPLSQTCSASVLGERELRYKSIYINIEVIQIIQMLRNKYDI